jgi:hypothetical protein
MELNCEEDVGYPRSHWLMKTFVFMLTPLMVMMVLTVLMG